MTKDEQKQKINKLNELVQQGQKLLQENKHEIYHICSALDMSDFISEKQTSKNKPPLKYISVHDMLYVMEHLFGADFSYEPVYKQSYIESKNGDLYPQELPYLWDRYVGACVEMAVTVKGIRKTCTLPVYDSSYEAKKIEERKCATSYGEKTIQAIDWADVHNAQMRCLTRCIAVCFGLAGYIYRGEDLPSGTVEIKLEGQYLNAEVIALQQAILKKAGTFANKKFSNLTEEQNKDFLMACPPKAIKEQFENGGDNREFVSHLISMASIVGIEISDYLKTTPQEGK